jgi:Phosphodiester glycosidase
VKTIAFGALLFLLLGAAPAHANQLPERIAPDPPFPRILVEAPTIESVAPGVEYGDYQLVTEAGPLAIHVVAVDPHRADIRLGSVLADDALESRGETIGSMAKRTGAVAGINADYFDIGNTNRPENIVVRGGVLLQMPEKRYALAITRDGMPHIAEFTFSGQIEIDQRMMSIDGVDEMPPPNGGISLLTPLYGRVPPQDNVTLIGLQPLGGTPPLARYRVTGTADNLSPQPPGYYVAIGPSDYSVLDVPDPNAEVVASGDLAPLGLDSIAAAVGGGPLILHDGVWFGDADGPNGNEFAKRIPCSGAAIAPDGRLFLIEVDGRQPSVSVGLKRPEFAALMRALGATEGLALDGGGSSTIAVRRLGDAQAEIANAPSDGKERPVADGLFVYSTAPSGPAVRLVARPGVIRAVTGADVPLHIAAVDAANHVAANGAPLSVSVSPAWLGVFRNGEFAALHPGDGHVFLHSDRLAGDVAVEVDQSPSRTLIAPVRPNVERNATIALAVRAYDARGYALALPSQLAWSANAGTIDARGQYHAGAHNAEVAVRIGDALAATRVTVGSHEVTLPFAEHARFATIPRGGAGAVAFDASCPSCVQLSFSFSGNERAAYSMVDIPLPADTIGLAFDLQDDGSAARLRVALRNAINEDVLLDATPLDQPGWRHVIVRFPADDVAARLVAIYVLPPRGIELSQGSIVLRNVRAIVAGQ